MGRALPEFCSNGSEYEHETNLTRVPFDVFRHGQELRPDEVEVYPDSYHSFGSESLMRSLRALVRRCCGMGRRERGLVQAVFVAARLQNS